MFFRRLYYRAKPFLPLRLRVTLRRLQARRILRRCGGVWPILPGSERPPDGWPGWPDGKRFAFVLTHDVENQRGLDLTRQLAELEMELGFRSSFNFVPEGDYTVPPALRTWLTDRGFEVGVHDLHHDGRLFSSRHEFRRKADQINHYLHDWHAKGFRAGFMLHRLNWLHDLDIVYDSSTFDTDPFEPQPDGMNTIFPFWVPRTSEVGARRSDVASRRSEANSLNSQLSTLNHPRSGYVELPYTLPQDSTLFLLLREKTIDIWKRKLDWIVRHGGMALVNIHPDYIQFDQSDTASHTFPVTLLQQLLQYVHEQYEGAYWPALPRDIADFAAGYKPGPPRRPKRVCMLAYSHYELDARVTRYTEALAERGDEVDVLTLRCRLNDPEVTSAGKVTVYNLQSRLAKKEQSPMAFLLPILDFLARSTVWITRRHLRRPYDILHIHNMPDFLILAAWYPKLTGAKVILDIHDLLPEFYGNKFGRGDGSLAVSLLKYVERVCARVADQVIISNHLWLEKYATRTAANDKCSVFINNVDTRTFKPRQRARNDGKQIILFPGGLQWHQGLDIALSAFKQLSEELPDTEFHIYGDGIMKPKLVRLADELGLDGRVRFFAPVPLREIANIMANADLGIVPKRSDSFGNEAFSTKILEFMSVEVPVVVSRTRIDSYYFTDEVVTFFEPQNPSDLARAVKSVLQDDAYRERLVHNALKYVEENSWESVQKEYLDLVERVIAE